MLSNCASHSKIPISTVSSHFAMWITDLGFSEKPWGYRKEKSLMLYNGKSWKIPIQNGWFRSSPMTQEPPKDAGASGATEDSPRIRGAKALSCASQRLRRLRRHQPHTSLELPAVKPLGSTNMVEMQWLLHLGVRSKMTTWLTRNRYASEFLVEAIAK